MFLFFFYNSRNFRIFSFRDNGEKLRTTFMEQLDSRNFRIFCFRDNVEKLRTTFMEQLVEILSLFAREGQRNKGGV